MTVLKRRAYSLVLEHQAVEVAEKTSKEAAARQFGVGLWRIRGGMQLLDVRFNIILFMIGDDELDILKNTGLDELELLVNGWPHKQLHVATQLNTSAGLARTMHLDSISGLALNNRSSMELHSGVDIARGFLCLSPTEY